MAKNRKIPADFAAICEPGETLLWYGRPMFWPYMAHAVPIVLLGIAWAAGELRLLPPAVYMVSRHLLSAPPLLRLVPAALCILHGLGVALAYSNTAYAYSNRRLLIRSGLIATSFTTVDYDGIRELDVTVGVIERVFGAGTIRVFSGRMSQRGQAAYERFVSIAHPYDVFRALKQVEVDVKTDWQYPNALRPAANPGYASEYRTGG
jgi:membrane protein YdbS with pleckstrin-like domain